jgi:hypothetical protein
MFGSGIFVVRRICASMLGVGLLLVALPGSAATLYRWHDDTGTIHITSERPPQGIEFEKIEVASGGAGGASAKPGSRSNATSSAPRASATQIAERADVLSDLRNRECVFALESLDRKTSAAEPTSASEIRRLQETVEANCSRDPTQRGQQEEMAARLRVANGEKCLAARAELGTMLQPGSSTPRERLRAQQTFVDEHCVPPVR